MHSLNMNICILIFPYIPKWKDVCNMWLEIEVSLQMEGRVAYLCGKIHTSSYLSLHQETHRGRNRCLALIGVAEQNNGTGESD